jgi:DNA-binding transcriptional ArsR family regulator
MGMFSDVLGERDLEQLAALFQLLSDRTRVRILILLAEGELNVTALCNHLSLPQPTVSHHLGLLRGRNIIGNRRQGKQVFYALNGGCSTTDKTCLHLPLEKLSVRIMANPA